MTPRQPRPDRAKHRWYAAFIAVLILTGCTSPQGAATPDPAPVATSPTSPPEDFPPLDPANVADTLLAAMREAELCLFDLTATVIAEAEPVELTQNGTIRLHEAGYDQATSFRLDRVSDLPYSGDLLIVDNVRYVKGGILLMLTDQSAALDEWVRTTDDPDAPRELVDFLDEVQAEADPLLPIGLIEGVSRLRPLRVEHSPLGDAMRYEGVIDLAAEVDSATDPRVRIILEAMRSAGYADLPFTLTVDRDNLPREFHLSHPDSPMSLDITYQIWGGVAAPSAPEQYHTWDELTSGDNGP